MLSLKYIKLCSLNLMVFGSHIIKYKSCKFNKRDQIIFIAHTYFNPKNAHKIAIIINIVHLSIELMLIAQFGNLE